MAHNIAKNAVERTSAALLDKVFPDLGKVAGGVALVGRDTVVAVDSGDVSKEFGGAGMEGMEMGYDASRGVVAMGHSPRPLPRPLPGLCKNPG